MDVFYPNEIDVSDLMYSKRIEYKNGDWSEPILYDHQPLTLQLMNVKCLFGILNYSNPQQSSQNKPPKFSTAICLDQDNQSVRDMVEFITRIEGDIASFYRHKNLNFVSTIKTNKKKERHLRIKLPVRNKQLQFNVYCNKRKVSFDVYDLEQELFHGREINIMIQLNAVWCSGGKVGVSWKLVAIEFTNKQFRLDPPIRRLKRQTAEPGSPKPMESEANNGGVKEIIIVPESKAPSTPKKE